ncbi:hypothetical protein VNI00_010582 [Paramarasmius palmivorus]|uniref:FBD domain-containing protein n=1 Tax=Paramarasmius palmivorus TaxID=297713 RepID=A0AAW0CK50_9AGAR
MEPAWSTLASQSHRWMSIHLGMAGKLLFVEPCFRTIRGRLNSLKHVSISVHRNRYPADDDDVIELFNACPSLESVILDFDDIDIFAFPYDQIKSLTIRSGSNESTMELLRECRNMEELFVGGLRTIGGNLFGGSFTSSKLRKLTVEAAVYTKTVHFEFPFSNYTVENLASLTLADFKSEPGCWDKFEVPPVADFLTRSRCSITTLVIKWLPITDAQAVQLIQLMPALGSLYVGEYHHEGGHELDNSVVTKDFLDALSLTPKESTKELNTSPLASHLTELTLVVHGQDLDQEALINMLVSRKSQDSLEAGDEVDGLRTVTISFIGEIESSFMHRLQGSSLHDRTRPWVEITRVSINTDPWRSLLL